MPVLVARGGGGVWLRESVRKRKKTRSDKADVDDTQNESSGWWRESRALQVTTQLPLVSLLPPKEEEEEKKTKGKGKLRRQ